MKIDYPIYEIINIKKNSYIIKRIDEDGDVLWIPPDLENIDYLKYLKTLEEKNGIR